MTTIGKSGTTISDAARKLGVSVSTIRRYIRSGVLPRPSLKSFAAKSIAEFDADYINKASGILRARKRRVLAKKWTGQYVGVADWDPPPKPPKPKGK